MSITYTSCKGTNLSLGLADPVYSANGASYNVDVDVYLKHYSIFYSAGSYDFTVTIGNASTTVYGINLQQSIDVITESYIGTARFSGINPGNYTITVTLNSSVNKYNGVYVGGSTHSISLNLPILYTPCTAPTSITTSAFVKPNGYFTVSWDGAGPGTGNSITGYQVYYKVSINGSAPAIDDYTGTETVTTTASSGSVTFQVGEITRTYKIVCGVVTKGSAGPGYYSIIKTGGSTTVNSLPDPPTIIANRTIVPSTGGSVIFTGTPGQDIDNQTCSLAYSKGNDPVKYSFISPLTVQINEEEVTYNFWTYDGYEFNSNPVSITITKNSVAPEIKYGESGGTGVQLYNACNSNGNSSYRLGWAHTLESKIYFNKTGTLIMYLYVDQSTETSAGRPNTYTFVENIPILQSGYNQLPLYDIHAKIRDTIKTFNIPTRWAIKFILDDGIEKSAPIYCPEASGCYYAIAPNPGGEIGIFNQFSDSNIVGTKSGDNFLHIYRRVRLKFYEDESVNDNITINAVINEITVNNINYSNGGVTGNVRTLDITLPDNIESDATIKLSILLSDGIITKNFETTTLIKECLTLDLSGKTVSHGALIIKPFTVANTNTFQVSIGWPFINYENLSQALEDYECSTTSGQAIKIIHSISSSGTNPIEKSDSSTIWQKNADILTTSVKEIDMYGFDNELGMSPYVGKKTYYVAVRITNLFGRVFTTGWIQRIFDFDELAIINNNNIIPQYSINETNEDSEIGWTNLENNKFQRDLYIRFKVNFSLYTSDNVTIRLKLGTTIVRTRTYTSTQLSRATDRNAASNTVYLKYNANSSSSLRKLGEISTNTLTWSIEIINNAGTTLSNSLTYDSIKQVSPNITFINCTINNSDNSKLDYKFILNSEGGGEETYYLYRSSPNPSINITSSLENVSTGDNSGTISYSMNTWEVAIVNIHVESIIPEGTTGAIITGDQTKLDFYSNTITVYNTTPTIAYRKNHLGINTLNPQSGGVIEIHNSLNHNGVVLIGDNGLKIFFTSSGIIDII